MRVGELAVDSKQKRVNKVGAQRFAPTAQVLHEILSTGVFRGGLSEWLRKVIAV